mgnify:CR=1 FL=1
MSFNKDTIKKQLATGIFSCSVAIAASFSASVQAADQTFVTIGTGGQTGVSATVSAIIQSIFICTVHLAVIWRKSAAI